ncbi:hypothetical protein QJS04_geneDACA005458 [Acorus gramineus]|uniref:Chromo domain-containing protein n=1 Tax=Acorus gramineus TaxID=55184 RepID=A0AAV9A4B2_ACOGR|nr:hypothetical protein QJS04_geneDACA005458 [Acorus gramineus]
MSSIDQRRAKMRWIYIIRRNYWVVWRYYGTPSTEREFEAPDLLELPNHIHSLLSIASQPTDKKADKQMARSGSILRHPILASSNSNS